VSSQVEEPETWILLSEHIYSMLHEAIKEWDKNVTFTSACFCLDECHMWFFFAALMLNNGTSVDMGQIKRQTAISMSDMKAIEGKFTLRQFKVHFLKLGLTS
jgi:hypothetical protein